MYSTQSRYNIAETVFMSVFVVHARKAGLNDIMYVVVECPNPVWALYIMTCHRKNCMYFGRIAA
jgi:hypothetical protein